MKRRVVFGMKISNLALKSQIGFLFSEYIELLTEIIKRSSNEQLSNRAFLNRAVELFTECLCYRDELDNYLTHSRGSKTKSIMNCRGLDEYQLLFEYVRSLDDVATDSFEGYENSGPILLSENAVEVIRNGLRTFGSDSEGWSSFQKTYFPKSEIMELRKAYCEINSCSSESEAAVPRRWTSDEDFHLVYSMEKYGLTFRGIHETYLELWETRSVDEIRSRVISLRGTVYDRSRRPVRKNRIIKEEKGEDDQESEWSVDDSLLELTS